jgi:WD40 repeat protein
MSTVLTLREQATQAHPNNRSQPLRARNAVIDRDTTTLIFHYLNLLDISACARTCKQWRQVTSRENATLWKFFAKRLNLPSQLERPISFLRSLCEAKHRRSVNIPRNIYASTTLISDGPVLSLHLADDGTLCSGNNQGIVKIWKCNAAGETECVETLVAHTVSVSCLHLAADGMLYTGSDDVTVKIWKCNAAGKRECVETLEHTNVLSCLHLTADETLCTGSSDGTVKIWKCNSEGRRECVETLTEHTSTVNCLHLAADGTLYTGSHDRTVKIWKYNAEDRRECVETLTDHTNIVNCLQVAADGTLYTGSYDHTVKIWKYNAEGRRECVETLTEHTGSVSCLQIAVDWTLYAGSWGGKVKIWKCNAAGKRECVETLIGPSNEPIYHLQVAADGTVYTGSLGGIVKIWDTSVSRQVALWQIAKEFRACNEEQTYTMLMQRFSALPAEIRNPIYGALYRLKPPASTEQNVFNYGELVFHNRNNFNNDHSILMTNKERAQAIEKYLAKTPWGAREIALEFARIKNEDATSREFLLAQFTVLPAHVKNAIYSKLFHILKPKEHEERFFDQRGHGFLFWRTGLAFFNAAYCKLFQMLKPKEYAERFGELSFLDQHGLGSLPWQKSQAILEVIDKDSKKIGS